MFPKTEYEPDLDKNRFQGVLTSSIPWDDSGQFLVLEVNLPFSGDDMVAPWVAELAGNTEEIPEAFQSGDGQNNVGFIAAVFFALIGGLLLNLMPCVFPVLSIKVLGFVQQAGEDASKLKLHGIIFTLGVVASFWVLAGLFLLLRSLGQEIGWGFQLQSPGFVAVLASFLFLFGLNLSGVFEIGESLIGTGSELQAKSGYSGSFLSGGLATVVATPCTAPFIIILFCSFRSVTCVVAISKAVNGERIS